ncbi:MAG: hypothetical protein ACI8RP_001389 [Urechidicola sp.]|jgi:hypothetical protein|tara:strand:+ start:623 stop:1027 length:405 start_codon:yes stop_codon:yes gene_type:complete
MRKLLLILTILSLYSCEQIIENSIDNLIEGPEPDYDTFLTIENTSIYELENFELYFDNSSSFYTNKLSAQSTLNPSLKYHYISDSPYISFNINNQYYEVQTNSNSNFIESGNYLLKINILSVNSPIFNFSIIAQ